MKCIVCSEEQFTIDTNARTATCTCCKNIYSLEQLLNIQVGTAKSCANEFVIEAGTLKKYLGSSTDVVIPEGVCGIGSGVFMNMYSLNSVRIPNSVVRIGDDAFCDCTNLKGITLPSALKTIGARAFFGCSSLQSIVIPPLVDTIDCSAFGKCTALTSVVLPMSLKHIRFQTFEDCKSLRSLRIPESVIEIDYLLGTDEIFGCFNGCDSLEEIQAPTRFNYSLFYGTPYYQKIVAIRKEEERIKDEEVKKCLAQGICPRCKKKKSLFSSRCKCGYFFS